MILLDTNTFIFALSSPKRLGSRSRARILNGGLVHYSSLSIAEIQLKQDPKLEKLFIHNPEVLLKAGFNQIPFAPEAALLMSRFRSLSKTDPFDWMLLAQAASLDAEFFTSDLRLISLGLDFVVDATL
jgi:PIN domain nuclease of toxin-antitoxin system